MWLDDCEPNCAQGTYHPYSVKVHAFDPQSGHFTHLTIRFRYEGKEIVDRRVVRSSGSSYVYT